MPEKDPSNWELVIGGLGLVIAGMSWQFRRLFMMNRELGQTMTRREFLEHMDSYAKKNDDAHNRIGERLDKFYLDWKKGRED